MEKRTKKEFEQFQKHCEKWREKLGLKNWKVHYTWDEEDSGRCAACSRDLGGYVATIFLSPYKKELCGSLEEMALHEVLHVLLGRYRGNAEARHCTEDELTESEEEVVRVLEDVLNKK